MALIYVFARGEPPWVEGYAVAEDGAYLAGHLSSDLGWFRHDMGLVGSTWKHDRYAAHYPDGYELVEAEPPDDVLARNRALYPRQAGAEAQP